MNDVARVCLPCFCALLAAVLLVGCSTGNGGGPGGQEGGGAGSAVEAGTPGGKTRAAAEMTDPREVCADESGRIMVLEHHRVGGDPDFSPRWTISSRQFREELQYLYEHDYYPINFRALIENRIDVPAGKTPVVLTFDDSSDTQFTMIRRDGEWVPEPGDAVGVLTSFHRKHPDWPLRATFFVLPEANAPNNLFGQPELSGKKLRFLVEEGMEVGTHTLYHVNLARASREKVRSQLARSVEEIHGYLPGYEVSSLSPPFGAYPDEMSLLKSGSWDGIHYNLAGAVRVAGGSSPPPGDRRFEPYRVPRIQVGELASQSQGMFRYFEQHPDERYVSDGNPEIISFPKGSGEHLNRRALKTAGKTIREYQPSSEPGGERCR